jgi:hypothetical protein
MRTLEIHLTDEDFAKLETYASRELRVADAQAKVFVLEALGLWPVKASQKVAAKPKAATPKPPGTRAVGVDGLGGISHGV